MTEIKHKILQRLPRGNTGFGDIRMSGKAYVDKTMFIEELENEFSEYPFVVRPRRFGKTLFTSMLQSYYDMCEAQNFEQNFRGTYIYDHKTPLQGKYRVLFFEFAGMSSGGDIQQTFQSAVKDGMTYFFNNYPVEGWENFLNRDFQTPSELLSAFFAFVTPHFNKSLYVIIDEYDQFANDILSRDRDTFKSMTSSEGFLKDFYAKLKFGTTRTVARVFITGVTAVSLDSMTSGFNIAENITTDELMAAMLGFTDDELKDLIEKTVDFERFNLDPEKIFRRMKDYYNGYRFSKAADKSVFNSQMCLDYLSALAKTGKEPEDMTTSALNIDIDKVEGIIANTASGEFLKTTIEEALYGGKIVVGKLSDRINLNSQNQFSETDVLSILFYLGMLTYAPDGSGDLICPNKAVREQFFRMYFKRLSEGQSREILTTTMSEEFSALLTGDVEPLMRYVASRLKYLMGVEGLKHLNEMAIETAYLMVLDKSSDFRVKAETEAQGEGFCDLLLTPQPEGKAQCAYIIEFKYLPKNNGSAQAVARKLEEAQAQLERYAKVSEIAGPCKKIAAVFVGADLAELSIA